MLKKDFSAIVKPTHHLAKPINCFQKQMGFISQTLTPQGRESLRQLIPWQKDLIWRGIHTKSKNILSRLLVCNFVWHLLWGRASWSQRRCKAEWRLLKLQALSPRVLRDIFWTSWQGMYLPQLNLPFSLSELPNVNVKPGIKKGKKMAYKNVSVWWSGADLSKDRRWKIGSPIKCANEILMSAINFRKDCGNKFRVLMGSIVCQRNLIFL